LWIEVKPAITVRFRHRRLAEYYAATFLKNRWRDLDAPTFTPWLAPVMNLTCAIEGPRCWALRWLVNRTTNIPSEARYQWRHDVEAAVEASFFAQPGQEYYACVGHLVAVIVETLHGFGMHSFAGADKTSGHQQRLDIITELSLVRALDQLGQLRILAGRVSVEHEVIQRFQRYEALQPAEWAPEFTLAARGLAALTGQRAPISNHVMSMWKLIQQPSAILGSSRWRQSGLRHIWVGLCISTMIGELALFSVIMMLVVACLSLVARSSMSESEMKAAMMSLIIAAGIPWIAMRGQAWEQSPSRAASWSSFVWRLVPAMVRAMRYIKNPYVSLGCTGLVFVSSAWRNVRSITIGLVLLAILGSLILQLTDVKWSEVSIPENQPAKTGAPENQPAKTPPVVDTSEPEIRPCSEIERLYRNVLNSNRPLSTDVSANDAYEARLQLTSQLEELRRENQIRQCGYKTEEGWLLVEDRAADKLFEMDARLVRVPSASDQQGISEQDVKRLIQLAKTAPAAEPPPGIVGNILLFKQRQEVAHMLRELRDLRQQVIRSIRKGAVDQLNTVVADEFGSNSAKSLIDAVDRQLKGLTDWQAASEARGTAAIIWLVVGLMPAVLLTGVALRQISRYWNRRKLREVLRTTTVSGLCTYLEKRSHSEGVRREILRAITNREQMTAADLHTIEDVAERLYHSSDFTNRQLAVETADVATIVAKRLRHRLTVDVPLRATGRTDSNPAEQVP
jgi:hypothetical protein